MEIISVNCEEEALWSSKVFNFIFTSVAQLLRKETEPRFQMTCAQGKMNFQMPNAAAATYKVNYNFRSALSRFLIKVCISVAPMTLIPSYSIRSVKIRELRTETHNRLPLFERCLTIIHSPPLIPGNGAL